MILTELDPDLPMFQVRTMAQLSANAVAQPRMYMMLLGLFAAAAVLLASLGVYGVLAQAVGQRRREIAIRLALGASRREIAGLIAEHAGKLALVGLAIGVALALGAGRLLAGLLFGVEATDAPTFAAASVMLVAVALVASRLPARRAAQVDPMSTLRGE